MKRSGAAALLVVVAAMPATAGSINMDDPFRAVGRENDVRVDAQLMTDVVRSGTPIAITYQVHNLSTQPVAIAEKSCSASYDSDSQTVTVSIGSEIPPDGNLPKMVTIQPGEKKTFSVAASFHVAIPTIQTRVVRLPRQLQVKVSVLRNLTPFAALLTQQQAAKTYVEVPLTDDQFDQWLEGNDTIFLNALPVRYEPGAGARFDASTSRRRGSGWM